MAEREPVDDWSQGAGLANVQRLCEYWSDQYDWRRCEAMLNAWNPHRTTIDGVEFNFFHVRSPEADALPVVMTHGWSGSVIEFHKVVAPLTDPRAHGGDPAEALPSSPSCRASASRPSRATSAGRSRGSHARGRS